MILPLEERGSAGMELESLTLAARDAAEEGRWDLVAAYYSRRGEYLQDGLSSPGSTERLLTIDREIQARIAVAQTALAALMHDTARAHHKLNELRQGLGAQAVTSGTLLLKA